MTIDLEVQSPPQFANEAGQVPVATEAEEQGCTIIRPATGWQLINVRELWKFRELLCFLAWRDVKIRYKQTVLGVAWAVLQPALMMVVFTIFFGRMAGVPSGDIPYPVFVYAGLLPWTFFATAVTQAGTSVVGSERLITKIYFPRLAVPFAAVGATVVDFVVALALLVGLMVYYGIVPGVGLALVPVLFLLFTLAALGVGTLLAALNVAYRDFRYVIPFLVQIWLFATPTVYMNLDRPDRQVRPASATTAVTKQGAGSVSNGNTVRSEGRMGGNVSAGRPSGQVGSSGMLKAILALNPMTPLIASFRAATLGGRIPWFDLALASVSSVLTFIVGCLYFRKVEDTFADIV